MSDRRQANLDRTHDQLLERLDSLLTATSEDWNEHLATMRSFHHYSPRNQILLAAQGATGPVASYRHWQTIADVNGDPCQVAKGSKALYVLAPMTRKVDDPDPDGPDRALVGFKPVPVFDATQLTVAPQLAPPVLPTYLQGDTAPAGWADAVIAVLDERGFPVSFVDTIDGHPGSEGVTRFPVADRPGSVEIRAGLSPDDQLATLLHEAGHVLLHAPGPEAPPRAVREIEAESVAFVAAGNLGLDTSPYSLAYVAGWAHGDRDLIETTTTRVLTATTTLTTALEDHLDLRLTPEPLALTDLTPTPALNPEPVPELRSSPFPPVQLAPALDRSPVPEIVPDNSGAVSAAVSAVIAAGGTRPEIAGRLAGLLTNDDTHRLASPKLTAADTAELLAAAGVDNPTVVRAALALDGHDATKIDHAVNRLDRDPELDHPTPHLTVVTTPEPTDLATSVLTAIGITDPDDRYETVTALADHYDGTDVLWAALGADVDPATAARLATHLDLTAPETARLARTAGCDRAQVTELLNHLHATDQHPQLWAAPTTTIEPTLTEPAPPTPTPETPAPHLTVVPDVAAPTAPPLTPKAAGTPATIPPASRRASPSLDPPSSSRAELTGERPELPSLDPPVTDTALTRHEDDLSELGLPALDTDPTVDRWWDWAATSPNPHLEGPDSP